MVIFKDGRILGFENWDSSWDSKTGGSRMSDVEKKISDPGSRISDIEKMFRIPDPGFRMLKKGFGSRIPDIGSTLVLGFGSGFGSGFNHILKDSGSATDPRIRPSLKIHEKSM